MDEESAFNAQSAPAEAPKSRPAQLSKQPNQPKQPKQQPQQQSKQAKRSAKQLGTGNRPPPVPQRDLFHRANFTYQASAFLARLASSALPALADQGQVGDVESGPSGSDHHDLDGVDSGRSSSRKGKQRAVLRGMPDGQAADCLAGEVLGKLARKGMKENKRMAAHNLLKLDPSFKRAICKSCSTVLIPGLTSKIRNRPNPIHMHKTHHTCLSCQTRRSLPVPPLFALPSTSGRREGTSVRATESAMNGAKGTRGGNSQGGGDTLDGPVRRQRMLRAAKRGKVPFHLREQMVSSPPDADGLLGGAGDLSGMRGHALWAADRKLSDWGVVPAPRPGDPASDMGRSREAVSAKTPEIKKLVDAEQKQGVWSCDCDREKRAGENGTALPTEADLSTTAQPPPVQPPRSQSPAEQAFQRSHLPAMPSPIQDDLDEEAMFNV